MNPTFTAFAPGAGTQLKQLEAAGLALRPAADGQWCASAERMLIRSVRLAGDAGVVNAATVTLAGASLSFSPSFELRALDAKEVHLDGVEATLASQAPAGDAKQADWALDAIGALQGSLQVFIRDAAWVVDAEISVPIVNGRIDFDRVVVEHV